MMIEVMEDVEEGVKVGGQLLEDLKFADDQGMVLQTEKRLQTIMNALSETGKEYDMKINVKRTKVMRVCRNGSKREGDNSINTTIERHWFDSMITKLLSTITFKPKCFFYN